MKKKLLVIIIILSLILLKLLTSYLLNEIVIYRDKKDKSSDTLISILKTINFNERYIVYYNEGNTFYKRKRYEEAIADYDKALSKEPPLKKRCDIRINKVLALIKLINTNKKDELIQQLEEARSLLYMDNCASETGNNGKSEESQELENEITEMIEEAQNSSSGGNNNQDNPEEQEGEDEEDSNIEEQLSSINKDANANRQKDLQTYENLGNYQYYSGKNW